MPGQQKKHQRSITSCCGWSGLCPPPSHPSFKMPLPGRPPPRWPALSRPQAVRQPEPALTASLPRSGPSFWKAGGAASSRIPPALIENQFAYQQTESRCAAKHQYFLTQGSGTLDPPPLPLAQRQAVCQEGLTMVRRGQPFFRFGYESGCVWPHTLGQGYPTAFCVVSVFVSKGCRNQVPQIEEL